jgi:hypothetical protein
VNIDTNTDIKNANVNAIVWQLLKSCCVFTVTYVEDDEWDKFVDFWPKSVGIVLYAVN